MKISQGTFVPKILLPQGVDYDRWAVVACDQFTQDRDYWDEVATLAADRPSALHITLPEIDLDKVGERLDDIHATMCLYQREVLTRAVHGMVFTRRSRAGRSRCGLLLAVDLEEYDYSAESFSLIRATEDTIVERLPPRVLIRQGACLESPHVLLLLDDPECTVIESLAGDTERFDKLYDFELMMGGGHAEGWAVTDETTLLAIGQAIDRLASDEHQAWRYGAAYNSRSMLFAVGDGNHSLAAAKACWEAKKAVLPPMKRLNHPLRYALVEIVNLHDPGIIFEPIHRVLFDVDSKDALRSFSIYLRKHSGGGGKQIFRVVSREGETRITTGRAPHLLAAGSLQGWLDEYLSQTRSARVDYIHGEAEAAMLGKREGVVAFLLPAMNKGDLFSWVMSGGPLPRKTFSMGEARDKRYYLECRALSEA